MTNTTDNARYHEALASAWTQWNGQRGTKKQAQEIMRRLSVNTLERMLTQRGVCIAALMPVTEDK